jgi:hypothetical protein
MKTLPPELKGKKASETFLDYIDPFLAHIMSDGTVQTSQQIEKALRIPWCVWNAIEFDRKDRKNKNFVSHIDQLLTQMPIQGKKMIKSLIERKEKYFSQYEYALGQYSVYVDEKNKEFKLRVESKLL